ncbi:tRNA 2-selenouridine(34) synthase MnmH [Halanaerobium salsuginis]|jgi:tRNA 2-selenouridine synthase|uniref:tRNA 2-selenouridine synthase n=1 Tax=Halanaerobium salsuginis TaxID=29563 RepID=A0A1I4H3R9_9FIRM|nr:tRNA 2-selenouridine(34) synthase MnmH [Halanaerobium salsuginis]SFL36293.1 tRNA 2-selenouridine synthase [Halanaerobium salsuginis]
MRKERIITYQESRILKDSIYIDVRTSAEYQEATIPGAVNIELLDNTERKIIGTIYKQESPKAARLKGVEIVSPKLPKLIKAINELSQKKKNIILFCARGGLRSKSLAEFAQLAGIEVYLLQNGYKDYRHFIMNKLANYQFEGELAVLHGNTGVGKTYILKEMEKLGANIIDLEAIANHRGSVFGSIGLSLPYNQKYFESLLWEELNAKDRGEGIIFIEAESKRIGNSVLPKFFVEKMRSSIDILITASQEKRVKNIYQEYINDITTNQKEFQQQIIESLTSIKKYLIKLAGKNYYNELLVQAEHGNFYNIITMLFENYYDPMYNNSQKKIANYQLEINADNISQAAVKIVNYFLS